MGCGKLSKFKPIQAPILEFAGEGQETDIPVVMAVFSNELIWKILGRCLNAPDLKCCRLVNRKFNEMVMVETKFKDRVALKSKGNGLTPEEFGKNEESWKNIDLNLLVENALNLSNYEWLYPLLTQVESLSLCLHGNVPSSTTTIDFSPLLDRLLSTCKKLKSLALEPDFIMRGSGRIPEGKETLENLEQIELLRPGTVNQWPEPEGRSRMTPDVFEKPRNVKVYKTTYSVARHGRSLKKLRLWTRLGNLSDWIFLRDSGPRTTFA